MKLRRIIAVLIAVVFVGVVIAWAWPKPEPRYKGRKLSQWLKDVDANTNGIVITPIDLGPFELERIADEKVREAAREVQAIGTNAVPFLLDWIVYEPSSLRTKLIASLGSVPAGISQESYKLVAGEGPAKRHLATFGFWILGEQGSAAVPELGRLMEKSPERGRRQQAMILLMTMGEAGLPPLIRGLTNEALPDQWLLTRQLGFLRRLGARARPAVPALIECLKSTNNLTVGEAAFTLAHLGLDPDKVVPALTTCLQNTNTQVRNTVIASLGSFGPRAIGAVPALLELYNEPKPFQRRCRKALMKIAPEVMETNAVHFE